ncbi:hypothetical protein HN51_044819 [Arachis hypogaea]|nr:vacuolar protein sorting-associated protein 52 A-like [Arachis hypogaea]QHN97080.1 Vacuolar protein sorting-associated protein A [Arachis hypogaea]
MLPFSFFLHFSQQRTPLFHLRKLDYIKESDNLISLHDQICDCDSILSYMETLLSGFQNFFPAMTKIVGTLGPKSRSMTLFRVILMQECLLQSLISRGEIQNTTKRHWKT